MKRSYSGFTIVELLIVVVVIAILAAITIVSYNGIQQQAKNSQVVSAVGTYVKAIKMYYARHGVEPMTVSAVQCFDGTSCWSGTDVPASQALIANLRDVISAVPATPSELRALVTNATTSDSVNGGNYTGWYILFQIYGTKCPDIAGLQYLNRNTGSDGISNCRIALTL